PAREGGDRHQLDHGHAEVAEVVEPLDRRVERSPRGERAQVQLVDHRPVQRRAPPAAVAPAEGGMVIAAAHPLRAERLPRGTRVRQRRPAVQPERVIGPAGCVTHVSLPPAGRCRRAHGVPVPQRLHLDPPRGGRPDPEGGHATPPGCGAGPVPGPPAAGRPGTSSATGNRLVRLDSSGRGPAWVTPVSTSRHGPGGTGNTVSAQPPRRRSPPVSLVATVTAAPPAGAPRRNDTACPAAGPSASSGR